MELAPSLPLARHVALKIIRAYRAGEGGIWADLRDVTGGCRVVGLCPLCHWEWLLGETEPGDFDCSYLMAQRAGAGP